MKCRKCGNEMYLDDRDWNFKGNYDNYWICENCISHCVEEVRFGQKFKEHWTHGPEDNEESYTIKYKIEVNKNEKH